jgi:hypothetical protein
MATLPTAEDAAKNILALFLRHNSRPGDLLPREDLSCAFETMPWRDADLPPGISFAVGEGWIEQIANGDFRLTDAGFGAASR